MFSPFSSQSTMFTHTGYNPRLRQTETQYITVRNNTSLSELGSRCLEENPWLYTKTNDSCVTFFGKTYTNDIPLNGPDR